jgi:hypothetical protein
MVRLGDRRPANHAARGRFGHPGASAVRARCCTSATPFVNARYNLSSKIRTGERPNSAY